MNSQGDQPPPGNQAENMDISNAIVPALVVLNEADEKMDFESLNLKRKKEDDEDEDCVSKQKNF